MPKIKLSGYIDIPGERLDAVIAALPAHVSLTRAEPGCEAFDVTPDEDIERRFQVRETFEDRVAFEAHQARAAETEWAKITAGIPRHYTITEHEE